MTPTSQSADTEVAAESSLLQLAHVLVRHRRMIITLALGCALVTGVVGLLTRRTWTSAATFMPQARRTPSAGLSGIAAQFGISVPTSDAGQSPAFYADFVTSRSVLGALADTSFEIQREGKTVRVPLADIFEVSPRSPALRREAVIRELAKRVNAVAVLKTGVVRVRATASTPELARQIVEFVLDRLNWFNLVTRQSQAGAERRFMETRLDTARTELRGAEDRLQGFLQRNRDYRNSPELTFQQDRLSRDIQMRQQVFTTLAQAYEQAKIEEVRDTPVITIVERPESAARPDSRWIASSSLVALIAGCLLGILLAFLSATLERERAASPREVLALEAELHAAVADVRKPWRLLWPARGNR